MQTAPPLSADDHVDPPSVDADGNPGAPAGSTRKVRASRSVVPDTTCAAAVELARAAAEQAAGRAADVGAHLGAAPEDGRVVTHRFDCTQRAYRGWHWSVTVARASRSRVVTVDETVLLPGDDALLAPAWLPWDQRVRPGDLRVGDLLPAAADDVRLVPTGWSWDADRDDEVDDRGSDDVRVRVLSVEGRDAAASRWYEHAGPDSPIAKVAPGRCATCGFWVALQGALGVAFGACANAFAPDDGRVTAADHGCGAHSEAAAASVAGSTVPATGVLVDDFVVDEVVLATTTAGAASGPATGAAVAAGDDSGPKDVPDEPFGHS